MSKPRQLSGDRCLCKSCGLYFNSTAAFDKHRVGEYRVHGDRRCLSVAEMGGRGMCVNPSGYWVTKLHPNWNRSEIERDAMRAYIQNSTFIRGQP